MQLSLLPKNDIKLTGAEEWKSHPDNPRYRISSFGNVLGPNGRLIGNSHPSRGNYRVVTILQTDGTMRAYYIYKLVGALFLDPPEAEGMMLDHIDNDPQNDKVDNLGWVTRSYNMRKARLWDKPRKYGK